MKLTSTQGNEHVTITYPDGRKSYKVNGIEQPSTSGGSLPSSSRRRNITVPEPQSLPAPPPQQQHQYLNHPRKIPISDPQVRQAPQLQPSYQVNPPTSTYNVTSNQPYYTSNYTTAPDDYAQPQPTRTSVANPAAPRRSTESTHRPHQPHGTHAAPTPTTTTTSYAHDRDRASRRSNSYASRTTHANAYDQPPAPPQPTPTATRAQRSSHHHQNHLQTTHQKSKRFLSSVLKRLNVGMSSLIKRCFRSRSVPS